MILNEGVIKRVSTPVWGIIDHQSSGSTLKKPLIDIAGALKSDFLVITQIPNFLHRNSYQDGKFLTFFGGANSIGTEGCGTLVNDLDKLRELRKATFSLRKYSWQALYAVDRVDDKFEVALIEVHEVQIKSDRLEKAMKQRFGEEMKRYMHL